MAELEFLAAADSDPHDVAAQIAAAYFCDRAGREADAIRYYDIAWEIGIPAEERSRFMIGYGSTLRNVGRLDESVAIHLQASEDYPDFAAHSAFLALALNAVGQSDLAVAAALNASLIGQADFGGYERALDEYRRLLISDDSAT